MGKAKMRGYQHGLVQAAPSDRYRFQTHHMHEGVASSLCPLRAGPDRVNGAEAVSDVAALS